MPRPDASEQADTSPQGEHDATPELLRRGYRFALSLTHDRAKAEDLLHDAWVSVLRADGPHSVPYLITAIRNRFVDQHRRRSIVTMESLDAGPRPATEYEDEFWSDPFDSVEIKSTLHRALGLLRPEERAALVLSAVEGYSAREIGELLDIPRGTVLSLMHRTRLKMRRWIAGYHDQGAS